MMWLDVSSKIPACAVRRGGTTGHRLGLRAAFLTKGWPYRFTPQAASGRAILLHF